MVSGAYSEVEKRKNGDVSWNAAAIWAATASAPSVLKCIGRRMGLISTFREAENDNVVRLGRGQKMPRL